MELDFRKLYVTQLFDFSKEDEEIIFDIYDRLSAIYDVSLIDIENSPFPQFKSTDIDFLQEPKLCYQITDSSKTVSFYLLFINIIDITAKGTRKTDQYDILEIWGLKEMKEDFGFISINRKKLADRIAGIFSSFNINFKENKDFKDFYVLGSDPYKTMTFLNPERKKVIKSIPDVDFKIEVKNNITGLRIPKPLSIENALLVSKFLEEI